MRGRDMEVQVSDRPAADIVKAHLAVQIHTVAKEADQPYPFTGLERKKDRAVLVFDVDMNRAVDHRPRGIDVSHVERARVGAAGKTDAKLFSHRGRCSIATGEVGGVDLLLGAIASQHGAGALLVLFNARQLDRSFDLDTEIVQPLDQQALVNVLGKKQRKRKWAVTFANAPDRHARGAAAAGPETERVDFDA